MVYNSFNYLLYNFFVYFHIFHKKKNEVVMTKIGLYPLLMTLILSKTKYNIFLSNFKIQQGRSLRSLRINKMG